jgi:radical SAM superfamily enzyme YgiQ (UPF0313 family)
MRVLLLYPRFPKTFWSYEKILALIGRKALLPPLGLVTVAALLPDEWELRLVDRNVRPQSEDDWAWADLVMLSAMIVQKDDFLAQIREARRRGKPVAVGGPYPTSLPDDAREAGADYLMLDEGEVTVPMFLTAIRDAGHDLRRPRTQPLTFQANGEKPDVTTSPMPRFDLLELDAYDTMSIQFSRGCPFLCEFCDIIVLYGRRPRTKTPAQISSELDALYRLGWRRGVFLVDDNFIGNKRSVKSMLRELRTWQIEHGFPFVLNTEASIDLAADAELLDLMAECGFDTVFIGIETPDESSLTSIRKHQNNRRPMVESVRTIARAGMRVQAGFIIGFDGEARGAGERAVSFIEESAVPTVMLSMLQALPHTALWERLERQGRLRSETGMNQTTLMNFVPTRPIEEVAQEYVEAFWRIYDPEQYLDRVYRFFLELAPPRFRPSNKLSGLDSRQRIAALREAIMVIRAFFLVCWLQGARRATRWKFWHHLLAIARRNPRVWGHYLAVCAHNEHYLEYREIVRDQINAQVIRLESRRGASNTPDFLARSTG